MITVSDGDDGDDWAILLNFSSQTGWEGVSSVPDSSPITILSPLPSTPFPKHFVHAESHRITTENKNSLDDDLLLCFSQQNGTACPPCDGRSGKA